MRVRIILADDHRMLMEGLSKLLVPNFEVLRMVTNGRELVSAATELAPEIIIADLSMPLLNGMEALRILRRAGIRSKFIVLTMHTDISVAAEAFRSGASAYVLKQSSGEEINAAIAAALRGRTYLSASFPVDLVTLLAEAVRRPSNGEPKLTRRQREVLQLVAEGKTMKEAANLLNLSTRTVESYKYEIMNTLAVHTNAELVQYAIRMGVITVAPLQCAA
jgi:DNA-binding NarL/FixJ family response regulator